MPEKEVQTCHSFRCTLARWEIRRMARDGPFAAVGEMLSDHAVLSFAAEEMLADVPYIVWRRRGCRLEYSIVKTASYC
jgi:hypothetical protein